MTVDVKQVYEEISADEGKVLHAYLCSEHHKTVGIGHKVLGTDVENDLDIYGIGADVADDQRISEDRCYELFQGDVQIAIDGCQQICDNWEELPQEAQHILVNMCWLALSGMLLYPSLVVVSDLLGLDKAASILGDMSSIYFVSVSGLISVWFGAQAYTQNNGR